LSNGDGINLAPDGLFLLLSRLAIFGFLKWALLATHFVSLKVIRRWSGDYWAVGFDRAFCVESFLVMFITLCRAIGIVAGA